MPDCNATISDATVDPTRVKGGLPPAAERVMAEALSPSRQRTSPKLTAVVKAFRKHRDPQHPDVLAAMAVHTRQSATFLFGEYVHPGASEDADWLATRAKFIAAVSEYEGYTFYSDLHAHGLEHPDAERLYQEAGDAANAASYDALHYPVSDHDTLTDKANVLACCDLFDDGEVARGIAADLRRLQAASAKPAQDLNVIQACAELSLAEKAVDAMDDDDPKMQDALQAEDAALRVLLSDPCMSFAGVSAKAAALKAFIELRAGPGGVVMEDLMERFAWKVASDLLALEAPTIRLHSALHKDPVVELMAEYEALVAAANAEDEASTFAGPANTRQQEIEVELERVQPTTAQGALYQLAVAGGRVDILHGTGGEGRRDRFEDDCETIDNLIRQVSRMLLQQGGTVTAMVDHFVGSPWKEPERQPRGEPHTPLREISTRVQALAKQHVDLEQQAYVGSRADPERAQAVDRRMHTTYAQIQALEDEASWTGAYSLEDVFRSLVFVYADTTIIGGNVMTEEHSSEVAARMKRHLFNCVRQLERCTGRSRTDFTWWDVLDRKFDEIVKLDEAQYPDKYAAGGGMD